jgi:predicted nucleic acid-binding protein
VILVDTSVWISHFRTGNTDLVRRLNEGGVLCHPFVIGELACGHLVNRREILSLLQTLPQVPMAGQDELLHFIEHRRLAGTGLGLVDAHLLASAVLSHTALWTEDKKLHASAVRLGVAPE